MQYLKKQVFLIHLCTENCKLVGFKTYNGILFINLKILVKYVAVLKSYGEIFASISFQ